MNEMGPPTYLGNDEESFIVTAAYIEGDHGSPLNIHTLAYQLHNTVKSIKF